MKHAVINLSLMMSLTVFGADDALKGQLNLEQIEEVTNRLSSFQKAGTPEELTATMNRRVPKYNKRKEPVNPKQYLRIEKQQNQQSILEELKNEKLSDEPLVKLSQAKLSSQFLKHQCIVQKKQLGKSNKVALEECSVNLQGRAGVEPNDDVALLVRTWSKSVIRSLDDIERLELTKGETGLSLWSDDYWRLAWGATSYRYANPPDTSNYLKAVTSFLQPNLWIDNESEPSWAPSEKYDVTVGDVGDGKNKIQGMSMAGNFAAVPGFSLTRHQKLEGWSYWQSDKKVEEWMGICHGWANASIMVPKPKDADGVTVTGADGTEVHWHAADVRAIASLSWANANSRTNFVGGRCNAKKPGLLKNGRIAQQECFDNNPATFHLALVNMIGKLKKSFVMDETFDYEVWNQPVHSYEFTYFNPLNPREKSKAWSDVAIRYRKSSNDGRKFAKIDRFRNPNTRGKTARGDEEDKIEKVVGVIATVRYMVETNPQEGEPAEDAMEEVTYTYDLELHKDPKTKKLIAAGGEWYENAHPDFLWVAEKGSVALSTADRIKLDYHGTVNERVTDVASKASQAGLPLCQVLSHLVEETSGEKYSCGL